ncbi:MAG: GNAT family N-acetyltransferase [Candidatus Woesearchaeota archaeon]
MIQTEIKTKRLILRKPKMSDSNYFVDIFNDKSATQFTHVLYPYTTKKASEWLKKNIKEFGKINYKFMIVLKDNKEVIGNCSFVGIDKRDNRGNVGYFLNKKYRNKGYMSEACYGLLEFGFKKLKLNFININHVKGNKASEQVIKKMGAKYIGIEPKAVLTSDGKYKDHVLYGVLRNDWIKKNKLKK